MITIVRTIVTNNLVKMIDDEDETTMMLMMMMLKILWLTMMMTRPRIVQHMFFSLGPFQFARARTASADPPLLMSVPMEIAAADIPVIHMARDDERATRRLTEESVRMTSCPADLDGMDSLMIRRIRYDRSRSHVQSLQRSQPPYCQSSHSLAKKPSRQPPQRKRPSTLLPVLSPKLNDIMEVLRSQEPRSCSRLMVAKRNGSKRLDALASVAQQSVAVHE